MAGSDLAQRGQHVVAGAHVVVVDLAGGALLVGHLGVVRGQDAVPGTVPVVDEMRPGIRPQAVVPGPVVRDVGRGRARLLQRLADA